MLESIKSPSDLKKLDHAELDSLSSEIRDFLIKQVSKSGGHLGPNLGVVELTIAIHRRRCMWVPYSFVVCLQAAVLNR